MLYISIRIDQILQNHTWHQLLQKNGNQKELYDTTVAVVDVVALLKDSLQQTSKWSLDICKWF